jgi:hypothetical protein
MRLPSGRQIKAVMLQEVAAIASDLPLTSITSASKVTRSSTALPSACHNSSIVYKPNLYYSGCRFVSGTGDEQLHSIYIKAVITD